MTSNTARSAQTSRYDPLLTAAELGELWGVKETTIHKYQREHGLPVVKLGPARSSPARYRMSEVEAWLQTRQPEGDE